MFDINPFSKPTRYCPVVAIGVLCSTTAWAGDPAPSQRVIVQIREPDVSMRMPPSAEADSPHRHSIRKASSGRMQALDERKAEVVRAVAGISPRIVHPYRPFALLALELTPDQVTQLEDMEEVLGVWPDQRLSSQTVESLPYVQAPAFHQSHAAGAGTAVAVLDTPVRLDRAAFGSCPTPGAPECSVKLQLNFTESTIDDVIAQEDTLGIGSHGTNVAGVILGVAPQTDILSLNVFHRDPYDGSVVANLSDTLAAMAWVAENASDYGIVAANTSLGTYRSATGACNDSASFDPIRVLHRDHGVLTVTVSGNDGLANAVRDPGCVSSAVTVGALFDHDTTFYSDVVCSQDHPRQGQLGCFSNLNGLVDIVAPGVEVSAAGETMTGTSQAAPHVAGAIAAWQSWHLAHDGAFRSAAWMQRNLLASSSSPLIHLDSRSFAKLRMSESVDWTYAHAFGWWYEELPDNLIPASSAGLQETLTITDQPWQVAGAYLYLEIVHPLPNAVEVTLTSPSGESASMQLPFGQANFTGLLGRAVYPGAFAPLAGSPANGTWTLSMRDTEGQDLGHYLQAALYLTQQGCQSHCEGEGCGDDRCGGSCGELCIIDGTCRLQGERHADDVCRGCDPQLNFASWSTLEGATCDDEDPCTSNDICHAGVCEGTVVEGCGPADQIPVESDADPSTAETNDDGGCGCRSATGSAGGWAFFATLAAALASLLLRRAR